MKRTHFLLLLLMVALVAVVLSTTFAVTTAGAEENGVIVVHFYNGSGEYTYPTGWGSSKGAPVEWGAYYWIDTGKTVFSYDDDAEFSRDGNVGRKFEIQLNASETKAVTQGKKLGLIMVRAYVDELGYNTPCWDGNTGKDLSSDRFLDVKLSGGRYEVWIIAGDKNNYTSLAAAKKAFERVESANFGDYNNRLGGTDADYFDSLSIQTTSPVTTDSVINVYKITTRVKTATNAAQMEQESTVPYKTVKPSWVWNGGLNCVVSGLGMYDDFDWGADYEIEVPDVTENRTCACKTRLYLSDKFNADCELASDVQKQLGVTYTPAATTFRVWAPISTDVVVNFYYEGNELRTKARLGSRRMTRGDKGVWELVVSKDDNDSPIDLNGVYYTYTNYVGGDAFETADPYSTAVGVNGNRSMVCNLDGTDPLGWENDLAAATAIRNDNSDTGVIWEVHVRDFSISPDSGLTYKGKYLAFTEQNTHIKGSNTLLSGIAYLKDLGVSYVHLNPVFDFATVDEEYINNTDYTTKQNWGYDPQNYNVPEGSYATDAENGAVRINEFKQMVQALHAAGIGVIMDVVYNHTATADSCLEHTVPGYYYRQAVGAWEVGDDDERSTGHAGRAAWTSNGLGIYNLSDGSGCSNETASERAMYRRYMVDSLVYWAGEYHIDGFRFDLMAIHDTVTMQSIRIALNELYPDGSGRKILLYGEPWAAASLGLEYRTYHDDAANKDVTVKSADFDSLDDQEMWGIRVFNSEIREGIKGNNGWANDPPSKGYVQGNANQDSKDRIEWGIKGCIKDKRGGNSHAVTYTTSHDNYTLWDQLVVTTVGSRSPTLYTEPNAVLVRKNMMAATIVMTSRGMAFMLAGEEIARTKYGNHNSYNAQDKINAFDYNRQQEFGDLYAWYKMLIALRKAFPSFGRGTADPSVAFVGENGDCLRYKFGKEEQGDSYNSVCVLLNPFSVSKTLPVEGSGWRILASSSGKDSVNGGNATLAAYSTLILVQ